MPRCILKVYMQHISLVVYKNGLYLENGHYSMPRSETQPTAIVQDRTKFQCLWRTIVCSIIAL